MCDRCQRKLTELHDERRKLWQEMYATSVSFKAADRDLAAYARALGLVLAKIDLLTEVHKRHRTMIHPPVVDAEIVDDRPRMDPFTDLERGVGI